MVRMHWKDFEHLAGEFFAKESGIRLLPQWPVHLKNGLTHKFDFSAEDERFVVQCKSLTWTKPGNNYPNGKVAEALRAIHILQESNTYRRIIAFDDDLNNKGQSFVEVFVRRNKGSLSGVEVWRHHDGRFEMYFGTSTKPNLDDAHLVELAAKLLADLSHRETTGRSVSFHEIGQRLGITDEKLHSIAGLIETSLRNEATVAVRDRDTFRLRLEL